MNSSEKLTKAAQTAELLAQDLRELHRTFCVERLKLSESMAECLASELLQDSVKLKQKLERIAR
jgi:hypothetical protein